jgi:hypothetical protein
MPDFAYLESKNVQSCWLLTTSGGPARERLAICTILGEPRVFRQDSDWEPRHRQRAADQAAEAHRRPSVAQCEMRLQFMTAYRPKDACIWVAVAAITLASVARAQSGIELARAYATPVMKFIAASKLVESSPSSSARRAVSPSPSGTSTLALELLPVFFVGLVAPLGLHAARFVPSEGRTSSAPGLSGLFQRPPPALA